MDTKLRGDIAEQAAILHALKRGWGVLRPVGDRPVSLKKCHNALPQDNSQKSGI
jgi:hypothetical protein